MATATRTLTPRCWYNPRTGEVVDSGTYQPGMKTNHTQEVKNDPEKFGLKPEDVQGSGSFDYDGAVLFQAMRRGWVRVFIDRRNPDANSNIEGVSIKALQETAELMLMENPHLRQLIVVVRKGPGHKEGIAYTLGRYELETFIERGRFAPETKMVAAESAIVNDRDLEEIDEIRKRAGL